MKYISFEFLLAQVSKLNQYFTYLQRRYNIVNKVCLTAIISRNYL